jgi:hypothetical protein
MQNAWGLVICAVGAMFIFWGRTRSTAAVYRMFVARSRVLWGNDNHVHRFHQVSGGLMMGAGLAITLAG